MRTLTIAVLLIGTAATSISQDLSKDDAEALVAYGQAWKQPGPLYNDGLPETMTVHISSGRDLRLMTDRSVICLEACRAHMLLKPFDASLALKMFKPHRLYAILEATSATVGGGKKARKEYGLRDINLVLLRGEERIQPDTIGGPDLAVGGEIDIGVVTFAGTGAEALALKYGTAKALQTFGGPVVSSIGVGAEYFLVAAGVGVGSFATTVDFLATLHCLGQ